MADELCACGKPLHYSNDTIRRTVQDFIDRLGPEVRIEAANGTFLVQRHYIALHGIMASKLEELAKCGIVKKVEC